MIYLTEMDILEYGWKGMLVALITCFVIEVIKTPVKAVIKKKTQDVGKAFGAVAFCVSAVLGAVSAVIFSLVYHTFDMTSPSFYAFIIWVISITQFLYAMYEKLGFRATLKKLLTLIAAALGIKFDGETEDALDALLPGKTDPAGKEGAAEKPELTESGASGSGDSNEHSDDGKSQEQK